MPIRTETEGYTIKSTDTTSMLIIHAATPEVVGDYSITVRSC